MMVTEICKTCGGSIYDDNGEAKCFQCGRSPQPAHVEPEEEGRPAGVRDGVVRQKRKYTKRPKAENPEKPKRKYTRRVVPQEAAKALEPLPAPFEQGKSARCLGCPIKAELQRLRAVHEGYRAAISDLGGHNATS